MHHLERWEHGGPTDLGNGIPLCWHDHHLVHEQRWRAARDHVTGTVHWSRPDGTPAGVTEPRRRPEPIPVHDPDRDLIRARVAELTTAHAAA
jgi:hypothetical protein